MEKLQLQAAKREITGHRVNALRRQGILPGILYGHNFGPVALQIPYKDFSKVYEKAGESTLVDLRVKGEVHPVVIHDVSIDPLNDTFLHVDFYKVRLDEKITVSVALKFIGESEAVRALSGVLVTNLHEIEVEAFPQELPHEIEVDISSLKTLEDHIFVRNLSVPQGVNVKTDENEIVASVQPPREEKEEAAPVSVEEVEVVTKEKEAEEEAAAAEQPAAQ